MWDVMYMCMAYTCVQREMINFCGEARSKVLRYDLGHMLLNMNRNI